MKSAIRRARVRWAEGKGGADRLADEQNDSGKMSDGGLD